MTREHATVELLRHGPLASREFMEITGWPRSAANRVLAKLCDQKRIRRTHRGVYQLKEAA